MASDKTSKNRSFDVQMVERLIGLMTQHDLSEVDLHDGDARIRLRRGSAPPAVPQSFAAAPVHTAPAPAAVSSGPTASDFKNLHVITSPTPGTFYARPSPDEEPYVKVGMRVSADSVVCKIEAMKIFNDIAAECSGVIVEILVDNSQPVEYGQPLFKVEVG